VAESERNFQQAMRLIEKQQPRGFRDGSTSGPCKHICQLLAGSFRSNPSTEHYARIASVCPVELLSVVDDTLKGHASWRRAAKNPAFDQDEWNNGRKGNLRNGGRY
jgi:hypothetical protein